MDDASAASRTAVLVCQGRAAAHGRLAAGRFSDPIAFALLREAEREVVEQVRTGQPPADWRRRTTYELVRACAELMVPRTLAIDDAIREKPANQLVILGAGLDARAWRMPELAATSVIEVDHPASQADKRDRIGDLAPLAGSLRWAPVRFDLLGTALAADRLDTALASAGHDPAVPTTWVWEGVVPYLTRGQVRATVAAVRALSAAGSRLVVNYQQPALTTVLGRILVRAMAALARRPDPLAGEPRRSAWTPAAWRRLLNRHGFTVHGDEDLQTVATRLAFDLPPRRSTRNGRVLVADTDR